MSSVPISKAYISKLSKSGTNSSKSTLMQMVRLQTVEIEDVNKHGGQSTAEKKSNADLKNDCKVSVRWDIDSIHVHVERKA